MRKFYIFLFLIFLVAIFGFLFRNNLFNFDNLSYQNIGENFHELKENGLKNLVNQIKEEVLIADPLVFSGSSNNQNFSAKRIIEQTNIQRLNNGLSALTENSKLAAAALAKSEDMFENQYFEHVAPDGTDPGALAKNAGYEYISVGENLIRGNFANEVEIVDLWMDSPGHRANILNSKFNEIGVAIIKGVYEGKTVWIGVQEFGKPLAACPAIKEELAKEIELKKAELDQLSLQIDAKIFELNRTNRRSAKYNDLVAEYNDLAKQHNLISEGTESIVISYNKQVEEFNKCVPRRKLIIFAQTLNSKS